MDAPMTKQNMAGWQAMIQAGMSPQVAFERMADWAAMLEERVAELDPNYQTYPWGRNKESLTPLAGMSAVSGDFRGTSEPWWKRKLREWL